MSETIKARALFSGPCDFIRGVAKLDQLPDYTMPEIAFAGRSNVGKSTLINALTNRKNLARTSNTPGRTQELNFFNLGDYLYLVDMPGYGYAKVSKKQRDQWDRLIGTYLSGRPNLRCVFVLIDARRGIKETDTILMDMLDEAGVPYRIVFTKNDKIKSQEREKLVEDTDVILKKHPAAFPLPIFTSAAKNEGLDELREAAVQVTV